MSSDDLTGFLVHSIIVRTYLGTNTSGVKQYDNPVTVPCFLSRKLQFVRDANAQQVTSSANATAASSYAPILKAQSKVTIDGRDTTIITVAQPTGTDEITGLDRVKAWFQ